MRLDRQELLQRLFEIPQIQQKRPGGVDRALGEPTHGGDGSVSGHISCVNLSNIE